MRLKRTSWILVAFIVAVGIVRSVGARECSNADSQEQKRRNEFAASLGHYSDGDSVFFATGVDLNVSETEGMNCRGTMEFLDHDGYLMQKAYALGFRHLFCGSSWQPVIPRVEAKENYANLNSKNGRSPRNKLEDVQLLRSVSATRRASYESNRG